MHFVKICPFTKKLSSKNAFCEKISLHKTFFGVQNGIQKMHVVKILLFTKKKLEFKKCIF